MSTRRPDHHVRCAQPYRLLRYFVTGSTGSTVWTVLWAVLELMVFVGSDRSGGPGQCGANTLALSQLIDLNILEFHTLLNPFSNSLNPHDEAHET